MATWSDIGGESLIAAKSLLDARLYRSSVSRAYFAAYCILTGIVSQQKGVQFANRNNPRHKQLPDLVLNHLPRSMYCERDRRELRRSIATLRKMREYADYAPGWTVERTEALIAVKLASSIRESVERH